MDGDDRSAGRGLAGAGTSGPRSRGRPGEPNSMLTTVTTPATLPACVHLARCQITSSQICGGRPRARSADRERGDSPAQSWLPGRAGSCRSWRAARNQSVSSEREHIIGSVVRGRSPKDGRVIAAVASQVPSDDRPDGRTVIVGTRTAAARPARQSRRPRDPLDDRGAADQPVRPGGAYPVPGLRRPPLQAMDALR
jgi:hypothetical protein